MQRSTAFALDYNFLFKKKNKPKHFEIYIPESLLQHRVKNYDFTTEVFCSILN